jgi:hypothetical protein
VERKKKEAKYEKKKKETVVGTIKDPTTELALHKRLEDDNLKITYSNNRTRIKFNEKTKSKAKVKNNQPVI